LSIESCVLYLLYAGFAGRTGKRAGIAGAIVAAETLVFAGNGFRCPLTELAERYAMPEVRASSRFWRAGPDMPGTPD
jgi:hypothetical protein